MNETKDQDTRKQMKDISTEQIYSTSEQIHIGQKKFQQITYFHILIH